MAKRHLIATASAAAAKDVLLSFRVLVYVGLGVLLGYFGFCKPELDLRRDAPETWAIIWGSSRLSSGARCLAFCAGGIALVLAAVFVTRLGQRIREQVRANRKD